MPYVKTGNLPLKSDIALTTGFKKQGEINIEFYSSILIFIGITQKVLKSRMKAYQIVFLIWIDFHLSAMDKWQDKKAPWSKQCD